MSVLEISESNNEDEQLDGQELDVKELDLQEQHAQEQDAQVTDVVHEDDPSAPDEFAEASSDTAGTPDTVVPVSDERANVPVSETTERFLRAILAKVPLNRIEELHLFSPLRQGVVETGIAVVAARVIVPDDIETDDDIPPELELELEAGSEVYAGDDLDVDSVVDASVDAVVDAEVDATVEVSVDAEVEAEEDAAIDASVDVESDSAIDDEAVMDEALVHAAEFISEDDDVDDADAGDDDDNDDDNDDSPYADDPPVMRVVAPSDQPVAAHGHDTNSDVADAADEQPETEGADEIDDADEVAPTPRIRHTVYTARYRLIVKGPERGKWEIDVVDEADAPLLTVETVVRGVQRRAGEETATVRYDARQLAKALRMPLSDLQ